MFPTPANGDPAGVVGPQERVLRITPISDLDRPELADYSRLTDVSLRRKTEPEGGLYIAESSKVITRALGAGHTPRPILAPRALLQRT